jgi:tetratricopeptide (TPR) repeat protein
MGASLDNLLESWKRQPDEQNTILLCEQLGVSGQNKLVDEVGKSASVKYASNPNVLVAIARMYMDATRLGDAQGLLVSAGKMAPRNGEVYRWLGEVLLKRGDAARASKVLERAVTLGKLDDETIFWRGQADAHVELQKTSGAQAVVLSLTDVLIEMGLPPPPPPSRISSSRPPKPSSPPPREEAPSDAEVTVVRGDRIGVGVAQVRGGPPPAEFQATSPTPAHVKETPIEVPRKSLPPNGPQSPFAQLATPAATAQPINVPPPTPSSPSVKPPPLRAPARDASLFPELGSMLDEPLTRRKNVGSGRSEAARPLSEASQIVGPSNALAPREVLNALALTGIFEPGGGAAVTWDAAPKARTRFAVTLIFLTAFLSGSGIGVWFYMRDVRAKRADEARVLNTEVGRMLRAGKVADLPATETKLSRSFDLDPNSPETALLWVQNRVLRLLEAEGESQGIDTATNRARQTAIPEADLAFARIGSFVAQGDTAGAAALVPQWDERSKKDPYFQLLAGVALERAGDLRAIERFQLAVNLDPELVPAQVLLARAIALEGDRSKGLDLARSFRTKWPDRAEGSALVALAWARDPGRGPVPPEAALAKTHRDELPIALRAVPHAIDALQAAEQNKPADARSAIEKALTTANTPGVATWLGSLALESGDDDLARRAALQAVAYSAIYPHARVLAARVALAGGRLDEALNAITELDTSMPEVAIVRAAVAYERLDADGLSLAMESLPPQVRSRPELSALARASDVLRGNDAGLDAGKLRALATPETAWGDIIAFDAALDTGTLAVAKELVDHFQEAKDRPPYALRLARYFRYTDKGADAEVLSRTALGLPTPRAVVERVLLLLATDKGDEARSLVAKDALILGPMASWVLAYIDADGARASEARSKAALLEPPGPSTPLFWRVLTALAMGDLGDKKRGNELVKQLAKAVPKNPDVIAASGALKR